ncbi:MAG TPA: HEAT repeat domain-containing protein, partial [Opitutus sp.]|nr:HEAT repeat domain-containing protein [Opitutus sp.]
IVPVITEELASLEPSTQAAVIAALARRGDDRAIPAIATATRHAAAPVRAAAIAALGRLPGNPDIVLLLARIAADSDARDAKLARQSLARLTGPGVAETVREGAQRAETHLRVIYLEQIASRYMDGAIPLLLETRSDPSPVVRSAALAALGEIAPFATQPALLDWAMAAEDSGEQTRALRALATVTLRNPDATQRTAAISAALNEADATIARRLLPVLPRLGGPAAAETAAALALRDHPELASAAVAALARWPDQAGLLPLIDLAEKTTADAIRAAAVQGAVRFLETRRDFSSADITSAISRLLPHARQEEARRRLVYLLGRSSDDAALALARKVQGEPALAFEATQSLLAIVANRSGRPTARASDNSNQSGNALDRRPSTSWNTAATAGAWIEIDLKVSRPVRQLTLDQGTRADNYPEHYEVFVTNDPKSPGTARVSGPGAPGRTVIDLPVNTRGRYVLVRNTAARTNGRWTISELYVD